MPVELISRWTLIGYACAIALVVVWRALRCPEGWQRWLLYAIDSLYCRLCFHWRANRRCPFLDARPAIVIANHRGPVDPLLIWVGVTNRRSLEFLTAQEYCHIRGLGFIFRAQHVIPVARDGKDMAATRTALRRLQEGRLIGVFPEGRINTGPGLLPGDPGVAWLALQSQAPVFPVFIENAPRGRTMVEPFWNFRRVKIHFGDPIDLSAYYGRRRTPELLQEITDLMMKRLAETGGISPREGARSPDDGGRHILPLTSGMKGVG